jgi:hypothetical protein
MYAPYSTCVKTRIFSTETEGVTLPCFLLDMYTTGQTRLFAASSILLGR